MDTMYERMLDKSVQPTPAEMARFCGENGKRFLALNDWLSATFSTKQAVVFPYGNSYGWGIAHKKNTNLMCNVFAEKHAFTVMMRLTDTQWESVYETAQEPMRRCIEGRYPCGNGGWIHYRVTCAADLCDIQRALTLRCS